MKSFFSFNAPRKTVIVNLARKWWIVENKIKKMVLLRLFDKSLCNQNGRFFGQIFKLKDSEFHNMLQRPMLKRSS